MIPLVGCESVRDRIDAFVDGELPVGEQVVVETHLRSCRACETRVDDIRMVGALVRAHTRVATPDESRRLATFTGQVLARTNSEWTPRVSWRQAFSEGIVLWPVVGATVALAICVSVAAALLHVTSTERPESLAAMIDALSHPGSERNPMRLDGAMFIPRAVDAVVALDEIGGDDAVLALATVITRDGTIGTYELLDSAMTMPASARSTHDGLAVMLGAVRQSRFAPAQAPGGRVVAVNMVWLLAKTTVRASGPAVDLTVPLPGPRIRRGLSAGPAKPVAVDPAVPSVPIAPVEPAEPASTPA